MEEWALNRVDFAQAIADLFANSKKKKKKKKSKKTKKATKLEKVAGT